MIRACVYGKKRLMNLSENKTIVDGKSRECRKSGSAELAPRHRDVRMRSSRSLRWFWSHWMWVHFARLIGQFTSFIESCKYWKFFIEMDRNDSPQIAGFARCKHQTKSPLKIRYPKLKNVNYKTTSFKPRAKSSHKCTRAPCIIRFNFVRW